MKCPKCQYIGFDDGARCRNCGYEFSLALDNDGGTSPELPIQNADEPVGPFADFSLNDTPNLPLFTGDDPDAPLVAARATPRAPLAVRRTAPAPPRPRPRRDTPPPEPRLALDTADLTGTYAAAVTAKPIDEPEATGTDPIDVVASRAARVIGGVIDVLLVAGIDVGVIYFTLRVCDLTFGDLSALPVAPLVSFLLLLNGGYLATFIAATGQTIGKMAAGTRVVPADREALTRERVSLGQSIVRAGGYIVSALPFGLGFLPAVAGGDRRALHDRLADTRVVKA